MERKNNRKQPDNKVSSLESTVNQKLSEINGFIAPYKLAWVDPKQDCILLEKNARYMTKDQLNRLADNIKSDGFLSQLPFGIKEENSDKFKIISGNHRVKAAIKAGQEKILLLYGDAKDFSEQKQLALQLSHNAICGQDDLTILQELYSSLDDLCLKAYTGINEQELFSYQAMELGSISEKDIELAEINFMFSEFNKDRINKVLDKLGEMPLDPEKDALVFGDIDYFISVMSKTEKQLRIKNRSVAFKKMIEICEQHLEQQMPQKPLIKSIAV